MTGTNAMINRIILLTVTVIIMAGVSFSQKMHSGPLSIQAGITVFDDASDNQNSYVQFPYSVKRNQFQFISVPGTEQFKATIYAEIVLSDTLGNHLDSTSTYYYTYAKNRQETENGDIKLFNNLSLILEPGIYKASLNVIDVTSKNKGSFLYERIEIDSPIPGQLRLSNIELAHDIRIVEESSANSSSPLVKNNYRIIPNPMGIYSEADSSLFIYVELYNLVYNPNSADSFSLSFSIYDADGNMFRDFDPKMIEKPGETSIITNVIDFHDWKAGRYELKVAAFDLSFDQVTEVSRQFVIYPKSAQLSDVIATTVISPIDTASLETKTKWIHFIVDPVDWVMFKELSDVGKSKFIEQFFNDKDPTPGDGKNEYLEKVLYHFNFANVHFSSLPELNDGWLSDRGRVLMQYGPCSKIDDAVVPSKSNPLQIWHYYFIEEGVYFIFQDLDEFGNFRLVHSNKQGERFDNDWEYWINNNGMESETSIKRGTKKIPDIYLPGSSVENPDGY